MFIGSFKFGGADNLQGPARLNHQTKLCIKHLVSSNIFSLPGSPLSIFILLEILFSWMIYSIWGLLPLLWYHLIFSSLWIIMKAFVWHPVLKN